MLLQIRSCKMNIYIEQHLARTVMNLFFDDRSCEAPSSAISQSDGPATGAQLVSTRIRDVEHASTLRVMEPFGIPSSLAHFIHFTTHHQTRITLNTHHHSLCALTYL